MGITKDYFDYHTKYTNQYGQGVIIFMQVGKFYEAYSTNEMGPDLLSISKQINVIRTQKNKANDKIDIDNPYFMGFPMVSLFKFIEMLIDKYTIVVVDQSETEFKHVERHVSAIYSRGTFIENINQNDAKYIMSIYLTEEKQKNTQNIFCSGMSAIELSTSKVILHESYSTSIDPLYAIDETIRFIHGLRPIEILVYYFAKSKKYTKDEIISYLEIDPSLCRYYEHIECKYFKLSFQNSLLSKIYPNDTSIINPIEYLNLENKIYSIVAFTLLIDFIYDTNKTLLNNISKPTFYMNDEHLILGNNAINQLNIVDNCTENVQYKSLFQIINKTSTSMGERYLKSLIVSPIVDVNKLNTMYDMTEEFITHNLLDEVEGTLNSIKDIERLRRKIEISSLKPTELIMMCNSYEHILKLVDIIKLHTDTPLISSLLVGNEFILSIKNMLSDIKNTFDFQELQKFDKEFKPYIFNKGIHTDTDQLIDAINNGQTTVENIGNQLSTLINGKIYTKNSNKDGCYLSLTNNRAKILKNKLSQIVDSTPTSNTPASNTPNTSIINPNLLTFKEIGSTTKIFIKGFGSPTDINKITDEIEQLNKQYYISYLQYLHINYNSTHDACINFITKIDVIKSSAKIVKLYNYTKPKITPKPHSFINTVDIRHPIVERLIDYEYIPHNIHLGEDLKGMLIYGLNSSGKCFDPNTPILMYNGTIKKAFCVEVGDKLMGDDSTPRTVLTTTRGVGKMYMIYPKINNYFDPFIVNGPHLLCLKGMNNKEVIKRNGVWVARWFYEDMYEKQFVEFDDAIAFLKLLENKEVIIEISVDNYLHMSDVWRKNFKLYKSYVDFEPTSTPSTPSNPFTAGSHINDLNDNELDQYIINSFSVRKAFLDGIISSHQMYMLATKHAKKIIFLMKSLGYVCHNHGNTVSYIPRYTNLASFGVKTVSEKSSYVGFMVDGNQRFLLGDFTVTHNSVLMKSIGVSIIMAQAGLYVPAKSFEYSPYKSLYTRITGNDNIFKGLSSFALEMMELNSIIKRSDCNTLVIGDEICKGTEHISGISLVASAITSLSKSDVSFIFATHLHEISTLDEITTLTNTKSYHLKVDYDVANDRLIYDRSLHDGFGEMVYGITVARYIIKDKQFIDTANSIKNKLLNKYDSVISGKTSTYNKDVYVYECQLCGQKDETSHISPLETHHVKFQKECKEGFSIEKPHIKKNQQCNLIVLCNDCHDKIHAGKIFLDKYVLTSNGKSILMSNKSKK